MDKEEVIYPGPIEPLPSPKKVESEIPHVTTQPRRRRIKSYAWRITASFIWFKLIFGYFFGWLPAIDHLESSIANGVAEFLTSIGVGFAPISTLGFATILRIGWLLIITGLRPFQLLSLFIYIVVFPLLSIVYVIFKMLGVSTADETPAESSDVRFRRRERLQLTLSGLLLVCWLLLYGGAITITQLVPGILLSSIFFLLLTYRLFQRSRPVTDATHFRSLWDFGLSLQKLQSQRLERKYTKQSEMKFDLFILRYSKKLVSWFLRLTGGKRGRGRVFLFVLGKYVLSLVMVALAAITFWAIMTKSALPQLLSLPLCFQIVISHFLPGIDSPLSPINLPQWTSIGPAATAWILFVVYIGPASNLLPVWQDTTLAGLAKLRKVVRLMKRSLHKEDEIYERLSKTLPP